MTIIYSFKPIKGLEGAYRDPRFFTTPIADVELVYTNDADIKKAYEEAGVKVKSLKKPRATSQADKTEVADANTDGDDL